MVRELKRLVHRNVFSPSGEEPQRPDAHPLGRPRKVRDGVVGRGTTKHSAAALPN